MAANRDQSIALAAGPGIDRLCRFLVPHPGVTRQRIERLASLLACHAGFADRMTDATRAVTQRVEPARRAQRRDKLGRRQVVEIHLAEDAQQIGRKIKPVQIPRPLGQRRRAGGDPRAAQIHKEHASLADRLLLQQDILIAQIAVQHARIVQSTHRGRDRGQQGHDAPGIRIVVQKMLQLVAEGGNRLQAPGD
jgi:hypothetical protein